MVMAMGIFDDWCDYNEEKDASELKILMKFTEKDGGREKIKKELYKKIRSHYDCLEKISDCIHRLGYKNAAAILRERLPQTKKARSGELGEIIASELVEENLGYTIPVRRLRYKDGRESALRGDDFIGLGYEEDKLWLIKGESKSRKNLSKTTIDEARSVLNRDDGRPTPISLIFVADRLLEKEGDEKELGKDLQKEVAEKSLPKSRIEHVLFTLSGNVPPADLDSDLWAAESGRTHKSINLRIEDHQEFIKETYEEVEKLGDD